jgi:hypothetical protein
VNVIFSEKVTKFIVENATRDNSIDLSAIADKSIELNWNFFIAAREFLFFFTGYRFINITNSETKIKLEV